jgi:hypothetical protein
MDKVDKYSFVFPVQLVASPLPRGEMTDKETPNLKALEADLEQEIQAFENSAIRISEILAKIKDSGVWKEANHSTFKVYYKARQLKRIEDPLKRAEVWEKLNQGEEPVTRKRVSGGSGRGRQRDP